MLLVFTDPESPLGFFRQGLLVIAAFLVTALHWAAVTEHRDWGLPLAFSQDTISRGPGGWRLEIGRQQGWFLKRGYRCLCLHVLVTRRGSGAPVLATALTPPRGPALWPQHPQRPCLPTASREAPAGRSQVPQGRSQGPTCEAHSRAHHPDTAATTSPAQSPQCARVQPPGQQFCGGRLA